MATDHKDGDRIDLSLGWHILLDGSTRDDGLQAFVFRPDGRESASLSAARDYGHLTGEDETVIPGTVSREIHDSIYDQFE